jgi:hypothetical protein
MAPFGRVPVAPMFCGGGLGMGDPEAVDRPAALSPIPMPALTTLVFGWSMLHPNLCLKGDTFLQEERSITTHLYSIENSDKKVICAGCLLLAKVM